MKTENILCIIEKQNVDSTLLMSEEVHMKIQNKQYTAGDLARFYGLSLDTIRLYDRKGILPAQKKTDSDYRLYTRTDLLTLDHS